MKSPSQPPNVIKIKIKYKYWYKRTKPSRRKNFWGKKFQLLQKHTKSLKGTSVIYYTNICHSEHLQLFGYLLFNHNTVPTIILNILQKFQFLTDSLQSHIVNSLFFGLSSFAFFLKIFSFSKPPNSEVTASIIYMFTIHPIFLFVSNWSGHIMSLKTPQLNQRNIHGNFSILKPCVLYDKFSFNFKFKMREH